LERLKSELEQYEPGYCWFDNIDVSKTTWPINGFGELVKILHEYKVRTQRFKAYKCDLNDHAFSFLVRWLDAITPDGVPDEFHLSDNNITSDGFMQLLVSIEKHVARDGWHRKPVWLRVENNQVDTNLCWKLESEGRVTFTEIQHRSKSRTAIAMPTLTTKGGSVGKTGGKGKTKGPTGKGGKGGDDAPVVNASLQRRTLSGKDTNQDGGKGCAKAPILDESPSQGKGADPHSKGAIQDPERKPSEGGQWHTSNNWWEQKDGWDDKWKSNGWDSNQWWEKKWDADSGKHSSWSDANQSTVPPQAQTQPAQQTLAQQQESQQQRHHANTQPAVEAARERSPRREVATPQTSKEEVLPPGWEKKFSKEYGIPYYWNTKSLESRWEKPTS